MALCDSRSVHPYDLIAADRIVPDKVGEVYYLTYNPNHQWFWLEKQNPSEPYAFVMYDTKGGDHARCEYSLAVHSLELIASSLPTRVVCQPKCSQRRTPSEINRNSLNRYHQRLIGPSYVVIYVQVIQRVFCHKMGH